MMTISALYEGKVQGVGFRASILSLAKGYEVTGWVKNLPDGRVEVLASGDAAELEEFLQGIRESHLAGHIEHENVTPATPEPGLKGFRITD
jgi:acylphosphatase